MAKDEDLKILGAIVVTRADQETGERPNDQAEEEQPSAHSRMRTVVNLSS